MSKLHQDEKQAERRRARALREELALPDGLTSRLDAALRQAEHEARLSRGTRHIPRLLRARGHVLLFLPAAACVALALWVMGNPGFDEVHVAEHELELPDDGHGSLDLSLLLHHHVDDWAKVQVLAPHDVELSTSEHAVHETDSPVCSSGRCRYEFAHHSSATAPHVSLKVQRPGRYHMEVEHASPRARVREVFVIHARR